MSDAIAALQVQIDDMAYLLSEMERRLRLASGMQGVVKSYDKAKHTVVVDLGYPIPQFNGRRARRSSGTAGL
ncbi:hypothetical protein M2322_003548 [Rhodoblastus acidophilus]|uniref:hypothetical protein n=1 Tax=Rhodoblastus acidophilus TaxID=1074 RepID=UPI0022242C33|nr:hypothetical protein [Rhodoblastus acidophilus]MCW2317983.1 hypothetical protein [Rhodoblastus acidophilus]